MTVRARLGLTTARRIWTIVFLGFFTLGAIVLECVAGLWHPTGWTIPWTEYIARYVPWPVQLLAYVALAVWLPLHFWRHDHLRGVAYEQGYTAGTGQMCACSRCTDPHLGLATTQRLLKEIKVRGEMAGYADDRYKELGDEMAMGAANLADKLPPPMLNYRTVDGT